ncbi:MAG: class I SAM-dependent methyltransferase [Candidatus Aenigmatarchaeota archaeon]
MEKEAKIVEEGYRKIARKYHGKRLRSKKGLGLLKRLVKRMPQKGRVLDVGCGGGYPVSRFFADLGYGVTGIDLSSEMLKIAKKTVPKARFYKRDMTKLDFPARTFDIIVAFYSIIHVPRKHHRKIISNFYRMLKPRGAILICMGLENLEVYSEQWFGAELYWSHFGKKTNLKMVRDAGFKIVWNEDFGPKNDRHTWILAKKA